ncbi:MAG: dTDP-glucose 4,6-dehydratase [Chlamydiae bacterium]|nr:dTDP-glucose 4,6-dehydratase [Chlamydiota bacterium]
MQSKKPILITGASGFVGANLARKLASAGEVHALIRPESDLWRLKDVDDLFLHRVDLTEFDALKAIVKEIAPRGIFHLAAHGASTSHRNRFSILHSNLLGTYHLLEATKEIDYEFFLHMGGSSEYGSPSIPMREDSVLEPTTFYGVTKACCSLLAGQFAQEFCKPISILRVFSVYGYYESSQRLIPKAIKAALQGNSLALTAPGFSRDFIFVEDVVDACLLCWNKKVTGEILNIGTGVQTTNEEVITMIEELTRRRISLAKDTCPPHLSDKPYWVADTAKAKKLLGWEASHTLEQGLTKTIEWIKNDQYCDSDLSKSGCA